MTTYSVNNTEQEKKIYCGREYEHNLTTNTQYNYIYVGDMPIALYVQGDTNAMYTLHTNYIGSIEKISDKNGNVVDSMSYTPFGQRKLYSDWSKTDTAKHLIDRGFTGQQHLDNFALINFNGRMYDPVLAHFLSPDPYIQSPENPLNYNRYAYCLFSPLQYVDPSGEVYNPIFDWQGNFLGTDDKGIQGEAIIMNAKDFVQNMDHGEALKKGYRRSELPDIMFDLMNKIDAQTSTFPNRPDWDGFVTIGEGIAWAKMHPRALKNPTPENTLYINAALLDLGFLTVKNSGLKVGQDYTNVNLYYYVNRYSFRSIHTTYALGNTSIKLLDNNGTISFYGDAYDWDYHNGSYCRNALIFLERTRTGLNDNHGFKVSIYGTAKINKIWPF